MKIVVFNLGCKVNQYECDVLCEKLAFLGHSVSEELCCADLYILNTCAVTSEAERKSRQAIARCKNYNPKAKIIVMGCASEKAPESFQKDGVTYVCGVADKLAVVDHLDDDFFIQNISGLPHTYEEMSLTSTQRSRAFIKIQDGCNHFCSYCIIPYLRGRSRSRSIDSIVREAKILQNRVGEIVLTGIDVMAYGLDIGTTFTELVRALQDIDARIRLSSIYAEQITTQMLNALFSLKHFCPHFHLSLQSADNSVLKAMNRHYSAEIYAQKIDLIRSYDNYAGITTDVIIGFPTETNEAYENTRAFVINEQFSDLHIFPYSQRSGTVAASLPSLSPNVVKERKLDLMHVKEDLRKRFAQKNIGRMLSVLLEEKNDGYNVGYSENYVRIYTKKEGNVVQCVPKELFKDGLKE